MVQAMGPGLMVPPPRFCADALEHGAFHEAGTGLLTSAQPWLDQNCTDGGNTRSTVRACQQDCGRRVKLQSLLTKSNALVDGPL